MTAASQAVRDRRRAFAAPGGSHDRLIGLLGRLLPAGIGVIVAVMVLAPLGPRGEVSFLLDRHKVAITDDRIAVDRAVYRGADGEGHPFQVTAGSAVQSQVAVPVVRMQDLSARLRMKDGDATVTAPVGDYDYATQQVSSRQPVLFQAADGYRMTVRNVNFDLKTRRAVGGGASGGVQGSTPSGTFAADRIRADLSARTVTLEGGAKLHMVPGQKMSMPR